jgi:hypothetical protein
MLLLRRLRGAKREKGGAGMGIAFLSPQYCCIKCSEMLTIGSECLEYMQLVKG